MNWFNIEIDLVKPICMINVSDDEDLKLAFKREEYTTINQRRSISERCKI